MTIFDRYLAQRRKMDYNNNLQPAYGGQLTLAGSGKWHRLPHFKYEIAFIISS
jgi:hypothetical protein